MNSSGKTANGHRAKPLLGFYRPPGKQISAGRRDTCLRNSCNVFKHLIDYLTRWISLTYSDEPSARSMIIQQPMNGEVADANCASCMARAATVGRATFAVAPGGICDMLGDWSIGRIGL